MFRGLTEPLPSVGTCLLSCPFIIGCLPISVSLFHTPDGISFDLYLNMLFALKFKSQGLPLGKPNLGEKYKEEERSPHRSMRLCYVTQAAVRKYHRLGGLNNRHFHFLVIREAGTPRCQQDWLFQGLCPRLVGGHLLCVSSCGLCSVCLGPDVRFLQGHQSSWIRAHPNDLI